MLRMSQTKRMSATTTNKHEACQIFTDPNGEEVGWLCECLEWEENRMCAENLLVSSDFSLITLRQRRAEDFLS